MLYWIKITEQTTTQNDRQDSSIKLTCLINSVLLRRKCFLKTLRVIANCWFRSLLECVGYSQVSKQQ